MTIVKKLIGGFGMVLAVMAVIIMAVVIGVGKLDNNFKFIEERSGAAANGIAEARLALLQKALAHSMIMQGEIGQAEKIMEDTDKTLNKALNALTNSDMIGNINISKLSDLGGQLNKAVKEMIELYNRASMQNKDATVMTRADTIISSKAMKEFDSALDSSEELLVLLGGKMNAKEIEAYTAANRTMNLIRVTSVGFGIVGIILALAIGIVVSSVIARSIRRGIVQITSTSAQILAVAEEQATGLEEEAAQISEVATSSRQLSATAKQVTENTQEIARSTASTLQMANIGSEAVNNVTNGMSKIRLSILDTAKRIEGLGERSQDIAEIVTLIEDVAEQTNILSLNAAIEAARAGESGKGFAVVADAIGKLAERAAKSAKDIAGLVKTIQQDTSSCVMSMEESTKDTASGEALAREAGKRLEDIESSFKHVAESVREITLASQQQASGSEQISKAIIGVDQVMRQSADGARQSKELARNLVELANDFKKVVGEKWIPRA